MAFKILPFLVVLCSCAFAGSTVEYFPVNTYDVDKKIDTDGLMFLFEDPAAPEATITVQAVHNGKTVTATQILDTDIVHGDRLVFSILIDEAHRHELVQMIIRVADTAYTIDHPKAGVHYKLEPLRRRR